ncbi:MAG: ABC transporter permease [Solirubrobacteraceae bacterium]
MTRVDPQRFRQGLVGLLLSVAVIVVVLAIGLGIVVAAGYSASATISAVWDGAFVGSQSLDGTFETLIPLVLAGLAWIVAFRAGRINVGIEGQIMAGGIAATLVALYVHAPIAIHLPLAVAAGVAGGALYAGIAAALWAWRRVNEIISTFMLNLIVAELLTYLVTGPLQEPTHQQSMSAQFPSSAVWPSFLGQAGLSWDIALVPIGVAVTAWVLRRTTVGFRLRMTGASPEAARHVGVNITKVGALALVASGGIAGLAATSMVLGSQGGSLQDGFSSGYGFYGIAIALLARNSPLGCIPSALLFAALLEGGGLAEAIVGINSSLVAVTFGIVVILASGTLYLAQHQWRMPARLRTSVFRERIEAGTGDGGLS